MRRLKGHRGDVECLAFSPDGATLATGCDDGKVRLFDVATGVCLQTRNLDAGALGALAFSPDGKLLAAGTYEGRVAAYSEASGWGCEYDWSEQGRVSSIAFTPDGRLGFCSFGRMVTWDRVRGQTVTRPRFLQFILRFAPDGATFARAGQGATVMLCDADTHRVVGRLRHGEERGCWAVAYTPGGAIVLGLEERLQVWDVASRTKLHERDDYRDTVCAVALPADATRLLTACYDGTLSVYDFSPSGALGPRLHAFDWKLGKLFDVGVSPDGTLAAACGAKGVVLWDLE